MDEHENEPHPREPQGDGSQGPDSRGEDSRGSEDASREPDWKRKRRLAEIFGDVLPSTTSDERGTGTAKRTESAQDAWLKSQVPPHHGGH